jgi:hypothetical protein
MIEQVFRSARVPLLLRGSMLGVPIFDAVTAYLVGRGHPATTVQQHVQCIEHFDGWLRRSRHDVGEIGEEVVGEFLSEHLSRCRCPVPACTTLFQVRAALHHLLVVLRRQGCISPVPHATSDCGRLVEEYSEYLHHVRGAAPSTRKFWSRYAREFLGSQFAEGRADISRVQPPAITRFITNHSDRWSTGSMKVACTALRSFFRFLQVTGRGNEQLVRAVPTIRSGDSRRYLAC